MARRENFCLWKFFPSPFGLWGVLEHFCAFHLSQPCSCPPPTRPFSVCFPVSGGVQRPSGGDTPAFFPGGFCGGGISYRRNLDGAQRRQNAASTTMKSPRSIDEYVKTWHWNRCKLVLSIIYGGVCGIL